MFNVFAFIVAALISYVVSAQEVKTEEISLTNGNIQLPGTLSYPETGDPASLIIFVHGSGNVDRNGNQAGVNIKASYIQQLADSLNRHGFAFYRYDKRSATPVNIPFLMNGLYFETLVEDVLTAIDHFKEDKRFKDIVLIGHSQGSLVAMLATQKGTIYKYISLAGPGDPIGETISSQISAQSIPLGEKVTGYFKELRENDTIAEVDPALVSIFAPQNYTFLKTWNSYDPKMEIAKLKTPVLILQGEADLQVMIEDAKKLHNALPGSVLKTLPEMNHVLKKVKDIQENQFSYYAAEYPLSTELVTAITEFLKE